MKAYKTRDLQTARGLLFAGVTIADIDKELAARFTGLIRSKPKRISHEKAVVACPECGSPMVRIRTAPRDPKVIWCKACAYSKIIGDK